MDKSSAVLTGPGTPITVQIDSDQVHSASSDYVTGGGSGDLPGAFTGTNINSFLGADRFYNAGYTGTSAIVANIEGGYAWSGHETLVHVLQVPANVNSIGEVDRHATWTTSVMAGRPTAVGNEYQRGMAYGATVYSGAFAAQWSGTRYALNFTYFNSALLGTYRAAMSTGMGGAGNPVADVINSSYGGGDAGGVSATTIGLDAFANANTRTLLVFSAGNSGAGPNQVGAPGSGYNGLTVAALGPDPTFNSPSSFSSGGPNDYSGTDGTATAARQAVDIAAPGQQLGAAYYGGTTGGNGTTDNPNSALDSVTPPSGPASGSAGGANYYSRNIAGTSFAAPTVAGGAALLYDAARTAPALSSNADARDARVIKAVLMNSADKTAGWDNGQALDITTGAIVTSQGLDNRVGTGRMNLNKAYDQFLSGTTDVPGTTPGVQGLVKPNGWDFGTVSESVNNGFTEYQIDQPLQAGWTFTATLTWFRDRSISIVNSVSDQSYDDLDLYLIHLVAGIPEAVAISGSPFNSSEHFSFVLPTTDTYFLAVNWYGERFDNIGDANVETFGLAWSTTVPEPGTLAMMLVFGVFSLARSRKN